MHTVRVATRTSALALIQTRQVVERLAAGGFSAEIVGITTRGDSQTDRSLAAFGGDGAFTKELESSLLDGRADIAVHSLKDLPTTLAPGLRIGAVLEREDARDLLASNGNRYRDVAALPQAAVVGTSSLRRKAMLLAARPDLRVRDLRGNVDTRIRKLLDGECDAAVMALAGVKRSGLLERIGGGSPVAVDDLVPAVGQGAICAECRASDERAAAALAPLDHAPTALAAAMERAFLSRMGGGCLVPIGAYAEVRDAGWTIVASIAAVDGTASVRRKAHGTRSADAELVKAAESLADEMLASGGRELVERFRSETARER
jgi:hydroxymethylbilane synthase